MKCEKVQGKVGSSVEVQPSRLPWLICVMLFGGIVCGLSGNTSVPYPKDLEESLNQEIIRKLKITERTAPYRVNPSSLTLDRKVEFLKKNGGDR